MQELWFSYTPLDAKKDLMSTTRIARHCAETVMRYWADFRETAEQLAHDQGFEIVWYQRGVDTRCGPLVSEVLPTLKQEAYDAMEKAGRR